MELNEIYNEDCFDTMRRMVKDNQKVDIILTSPPYCTPNDDASKYTENKFNNYQVHYDVFTGFSGPEHYRDWTKQLFNHYHQILNSDGVILYNISYTAKNPELIYLVLSDIINFTPFTIADCISWKKKSALPANQDRNRLTRICEFVFVIVRKTELLTFRSNKERVANQKYKNLFFNYIEAPNNDILDRSVQKLNSATFSTSLVTQLLDIYAKSEYVVYDSFIGTGTTAVACKKFGCNFIGSEISAAQVEFANRRLIGAHIHKTNRQLF